MNFFHEDGKVLIGDIKSFSKNDQLKIGKGLSRE
jgi:hypothetical protein